MKEFVFEAGTFLHRMYVWCLWVMSTWNDPDFSGDDVVYRIKRYQNHTDICRVIRAFLFAPVAIILNICAYLLATTSVLLPFILYPNGAIIIILGTLLFLAAILGIVFGTVWLSENDEIKDMAGLAYHSIKDKVCFMITFKGVENVKE
jgi:hypothetical protein